MNLVRSKYSSILMMVLELKLKFMSKLMTNHRLFSVYSISDGNKTRNSKEAIDEVDNISKQKLGKRTSKFQAAVHKAREKLKRDSSSSSEDSDDISYTSDEEIEDRLPPKSGENSIRG